MGTMELAWALDDLDGHSSNPQVVAFVKAALRDLTRPAPRPLRIAKRDMLHTPAAINGPGCAGDPLGFRVVARSGLVTAEVA